MIAALTTEGSIVNLEEYGDFHIETHSAMDGQFQVKAYPSRTAASVNSINLAQGSKEACKAYVRKTLAPLLGLDTRTVEFTKHYGQTSVKTPAKSKSKRAPEKPKFDAGVAGKAATLSE